MQHDIAILTSKDTNSNGTSGIPQGQNSGSNNQVVQLGITYIVPNVIIMAGTTFIAVVGTSASSTFITEKRLQEVLRLEAGPAKWCQQ